MTVTKSKKNKYVDSKGKSLPGVTTILQVLNKPALMHWAYDCGCKGIDYRKVRDGRAAIGSLVHDMIECDLLGLPIPNVDKFSPEDLGIALTCKNHFDVWRSKQKSFEVLDVELVMADEELGFGGTCDLYYKADGKYTLMDFKTSKACYDEHKAQQGAYKLLLEKLGKPVDEVKLFQLNELKTGVVTIPNNLVPLYTNIFLGALGVYKAQRALDIVTNKAKAKTSAYKTKAIKAKGKSEASL